MTVRLLKPWKGYQAGVVLRVDDSKAPAMIRLGICVPVTREAMRPRRQATKPDKPLVRPTFRDPYPVHRKRTPE